MGFMTKALSGVTTEDIESASATAFSGLDEGDYVCKITDAKLGTKNGGQNDGAPQIEVSVKPIENWDGQSVDGPTLRAWITLVSTWEKSGKSNFQLFQFLSAIDGWDYENDEMSFDFDDEDDLFDQLVGKDVNVRVGYRVTESTAQHPNPRVFNNVDRWLSPTATLRGGTKTFQQAVEELPAPDAPAGGGVKAKTKRTKAGGVSRVKFEL